VRSEKHREKAYKTLALAAAFAALGLSALTSPHSKSVQVSLPANRHPRESAKPGSGAVERAAATEGSGVESVSTQSLGSSERELTPELRDLAEGDPLTAAQRMGDLPGRLRVELAGLIASAWGKSEPELAAAWARDQLEGEARDQALLSVSSDWAAVNPIAAAESGLALLPEQRQEEFLKTVGMQWGRQDSAAAMAWAGHLPDGIARDSFLAGLCSTLADTSPQQAAQLAASLGNGRLAEESALTVVLEWGRQQPEAAAEWVRLFPPGQLREKALSSLTSLWAEGSSSISAPPALLVWQSGPERDQAIRHYLDEVLEAQPVRGVEVLAAISNVELRQEETERLAQHWLMQDPDGARQWLAQGSITTQSSQQLSCPREGLP
jgi:hypothetical protein